MWISASVARDRSVTSIHVGKWLCKQHVAWLHSFNADLFPEKHWQGPRFHWRGENMETRPDASLSPPGGGKTYKLYLSLHCHHQQGGKHRYHTCRFTVNTRRGKTGKLYVTLHCYHQEGENRETIHDISLLPPGGGKQGNNTWHFTVTTRRGKTGKLYVTLHCITTRRGKTGK